LVAKCTKNGLSVDYNYSSTEIGQWIRHTFGLLFLDKHEVSECFLNDFMSDCPNDEGLKKYCDRLDDNFINDYRTYFHHNIGLQCCVGKFG